MKAEKTINLIILLFCFFLLGFTVLTTSMFNEKECEDKGGLELIEFNEQAHV